MTGPISTIFKAPRDGYDDGTHWTPSIAIPILTMSTIISMVAIMPTITTIAIMTIIPMIAIAPIVMYQYLLLLRLMLL